MRVISARRAASRSATVLPADGLPSQVEHARAARRRVVVGADRQRHLVLAHQLLGEARRVVAVENGRQHFQRVGVAVLVDIAQDRRLVAHDQHRQFGRRLDGDPARAVLRRLVLRLARRQRAPFQLAIVFLGQREDLLVIDVADDHDVGVVRHVPGVVPGLGVGGAHVLEIVHPADDRPAIGVGLEGDGVHLLEQPATAGCRRCACGALP